MNTGTTSWKRRDAELYGELPARYTQYVRQLCAHIVAEIARLADPQPGEILVDVGSGTGTATEALAQASAGAQVLGVDYSIGCCQYAQTALRNFPGAAFQVMDAERLGLRSNSADVLVSFSAIFHFPNPQAAIQEMARVLRPGGRLVLTYHNHADGSGLESGLVPAAWVAPSCLQTVAADVLPAPKHQPVPEWSSALADQKIRTWIEAAGFEVLEATRSFERTLWLDATEFFEVQMMVHADLRTRASEAPPLQREELRNRFVRSAEEAQTQGAELVYPFGANCLLARLKP